MQNILSGARDISLKLNCETEPRLNYGRFVTKIKCHSVGFSPVLARYIVEWLRKRSIFQALVECA